MFSMGECRVLHHCQETFELVSHPLVLPETYLSSYTIVWHGTRLILVAILILPEKYIAWGIVSMSISVEI